MTQISMQPVTPGQGTRRAPAAHWLDLGRLRLYSRVALVCYALYFGIWSFRACALQVPGVFAPGGDFVVFWSAAKLALANGAAAPYDYAMLWQVELATVPNLALGYGVLPWLYPPTFLLFVLAFGLLPYGLATFLFLAGGAGWYAWALCRTLPREAWLAGMAFPGIAVVLACGQNALWLAGCAGLALACLRSRPVLAGVLLGLVTVKPHLALMFPVALLCARNWRALGAMAATALALALAALLAFGTEPFVAFLGNAGRAAAELEKGAVLFERMPTVFVAVKALSGSLALSYALHAMVAAAALAAVIYAWSRPCSFALRAAVLACAGLLVPAYLWDYDLAFLGLAIAWLGTHGHRNGWLRGERELLVLLWLLPLYGMSLGGWIGFQPMPLGLMLALALGVWRIRQERTGKASCDA
ncbi:MULTISPECIES: glycosyltransferase family 87 protein [Cupriavidus]|uniref:glycosyltransferase family 87 protein n=1 Tax=Cupriavidus sp. DF5525 TaxID=3160989 RepID=UPI0032DF4222